MRNIWRLFVGDLKRMGGNTLTAIVFVGLVLLPSLFSWYNIIACWDVFDNTGNLSVAVANSDEGYQSDLVRLKVNIGENVVSALRENDQLNWVFTDEEDAIDGTRAGRYYAAVVIPEDFSRDMLSLLDTDAADPDADESATILYYVNDKKNAIAPKVTDQGADTVSTQVNKVFTETLAEIALTIASSLAEYADDADLQDGVAQLAAHLKRTATQLQRTAATVELYAEVVVSAQELVDDSAKLLAEAHEAAEDVSDSAKQAKDSADSTVTALDDAAEQLATALDQSAAAYAAVPGAIESAFDATDGLAADAAASLRNRAAAVDALAGDYRDIAQELADLEEDLPASLAADIETIVMRLNATAAQQEDLRDALNAAADDIDAKGTVSKDTREQVTALADQAAASLQEAKEEYDANLKPAIQELSDVLESATASISDTAGQLDAADSGISGTASSLKSDLRDAQGTLASAADGLVDAAGDVEQLGDDIEEALASGDSAKLREVIGADPSALAAAISAPATIDRVAIYPVDNFGSAMSPLYTTLALWIGSLLMMVALRMLPSERTMGELDDPTPRQVFCGRFGIVAVLSLAQSTTMALGNLFFLGVQANNPLLYLLCFWVTGLAFALIVYTLVASFANLGKALAVVLLILQVSGGGGSFPLQLLPQAVQAVSPFLPITHAVNAMRAAMFGIYQGDFWIELALTACFAIPLVVLALIFLKPLQKIVSQFIARVEESKLM